MFNFLSKKLIHVKQVCLRFKLFLFLRQCPKTIHELTHLSKLKNVDDNCLFQSLYSCKVAKTINRTSFTFVCQKGRFRQKTEKVNTTIESAFWN